jgi:hypothetical protein
MTKEELKEKAEYDYNEAKKEIEAELLKCYQGYPEAEDFIGGKI